MARVGDISIGFIADISKFMSGSEKVRNQLRQIGGPAAKLNGILGRMATPAGIAGVALAGVTTAAYMAKQAFDHLSEVAKQLDDIADSAENIGVGANQLMKLQFAAEHSGASAESMTSALKKMMRTLGEARGGNKGAIADLKKLGLNIDAVTNAEPDEAFRMIAAGFQNIKNPADKATVAVGIFGKAGQDMIGTLNRGGDGLDRLAKKFDILGPKLTELDWKNIGILDKRTKDAEAAVRGAEQKIAANLAPDMSRYQEAKIGAGAAVSSRAGQAVFQTLKDQAFPLAKVMSWINPIAIGFNLLADEGKRISDIAPDASLGLGKISEATQNLLATATGWQAQEFGVSAFAKASKNEATATIEKLMREQVDIARKTEANTRPPNARPQEPRRI